ncbi:hypothetical protein CHRYSEO8AT_280025 [Chryseobacterium sp. 8AT]|nr:hypothetical protein CHRYSEO8AT_280025 [Chryseobacterium sp. 8AT]
MYKYPINQYFKYICSNKNNLFLCLIIEVLAPKLAPYEFYLQT